MATERRLGGLLISRSGALSVFREDGACASRKRPYVAKSLSTTPGSWLVSHAVGKLIVDANFVAFLVGLWASPVGESTC